MPEKRPGESTDDSPGDTFDLASPAEAGPSSAGPEEPRYAEQELVGEGAIGEVRAVLDRQLGRRVARKTLKPGARGSRSATARFVREAVVTARLEHPGIVTVHDAGWDDDGSLFYTMRLIRGTSLRDRLASVHTRAERLALVAPFLQFCNAVAYAHSTGTIHRDLKPANLMLGAFGETQVLDWGLARAEWVDEPGQARLFARAGRVKTLHGDMVGTPAYMSPEQSLGRPADARSDVWSLGAILQEILTGRPPFEGQTTSKVLGRLRVEAPRPLLEIDPELPPDLAAIADRALQRSAAARYADAGEMAADVERWLLGERVDAYRYSSAENVRRLVARHRAAAATISLATLALLAIGAWSWFRTAEERDRALAAEQAAQTALRASDDALSRSLLQQATIAARQDLRAESEILAAKALSLTDSPLARGLLAAFSAAPAARRVRTVPLPNCDSGVLDDTAAAVVCFGPSGLSLRDADTGKDRWHRDLPIADAIPALSLGRVVASSAQERTWLLDAADGSTVATLPQRLPDSGWRVDASGTLVGMRTRELQAWKLPSGEKADYARYPCGDAPRIHAVAPRGDGELAVACPDGRILLAPADGAAPRTLGRVGAAAGAGVWTEADFSPDRSRLAVGADVSGVRIVDVVSGNGLVQAVTPLLRVHQVRWSPDGELLLVRDDAGDVAILRGDTGALVTRLPTTEASDAGWTGARTLVVVDEKGVSTWEVSDAPLPRWTGPEGLTAALPTAAGTLHTAHGDGTLLEWSIATGGRVADRTWHTSAVKGLDLTDTGELVACASGAPGIFRLGATRENFTVGGAPASFRRIVALAGSRLLAASYGRALYAWELSASDQGKALELPEAEYLDLARSHDRGTVAWTAAEQGAWVRVGESAPRPVTWDREVGAVTVSPDGARVAVAVGDRIDVVDTVSGDRVLRFPADGESVLDLAWSPDGRFIAAGDFDRAARVWEAATGRLLLVMRAHTERVASVAFDPSRPVLYTGSWDRSARAWNLAGLAEPRESLLPKLTADWGVTVDEAIAERVE